MDNSNRNSNEVVFKIVRNIATLSTSQTGWNKELNVVSWNGGAPKYDIRDWDPNHERMTRGITLRESEIKALSQVLNNEVKDEM